MQMISAFPTMQGVVPVWTRVLSDMGKRVLDFSINHFNLIINGSVTAYGAEEIVLNCIAAAPEIASLNAKIDQVRKNQLLVHGTCYALSGVLGITEILAQYGLYQPGVLSSLCGAGAWGLFIFANLYSLEKHIKLYELADKLPEVEGRHLKISASLGIINSLGYVMTGIFSFFPGTLGIAIALSCLSILAGTVKFFYDIMALRSK